MKEEDSKPQSNMLKICTMHDPDDHPRQCSVLMAKKLLWLDIDFAALSEVHFAKQGSLMEDGAGYTLFWSGKNKDECHLSGVGFMIKTSIAENVRTCQLVIQTASCP